MIPKSSKTLAECRRFPSAEGSFRPQIRPSPTITARDGSSMMNINGSHPAQSSSAQDGRVPCPQCGSTDARPIAANYIECVATITERVLVGHRPVPGPSPLHPGMQTVVGLAPIYETRSQACGFRHHVGMSVDSWPECACGTFAIGRCHVCQEPVCGDDSARVSASRLCTSCAASEESRRRAEQRKGRAEAIRTSVAPIIAIWTEGCKAGHNPKDFAPDGRCWDCYPRIGD